MLLQFFRQIETIFSFRLNICEFIHILSYKITLSYMIKNIILSFREPAIWKFSDFITKCFKFMTFWLIGRKFESYICFALLMIFRVLFSNSAALKIDKLISQMWQIASNAKLYHMHQRKRSRRMFLLFLCCPFLHIFDFLLVLNRY